MPDVRDAYWHDLLQSHGHAMLGLARSLLRHARLDGIQPEDLVQEVWTALLSDGGRALGAIDARGPGPYLSVCVANAVRKHRRGRRRQPERLPGFEDPLLRMERAETVERAMSALEPEEALILRWIYWEGLSYARAARLAGIRENSVGPLLSRAREHLRRALESGKPAREALDRG